MIEDPKLKEFIQSIAPNVQLPSAAELRNRIVDLAKDYGDHITVDYYNVPFLSLMIDGITVKERTWLGVCVGTKGKYRFLRLLEMDNQQSETIADVLVPVVEKLRGMGFIIPAIVTDNATNEKKAVQLLAKKAGIPLFRVACLSHTMNLAIHDVLKDVSGLKDDGFFTEMNTLRDALPIHIRDNKEHMRIRQGCKTRWLSLGGFFSDIVREGRGIRTKISSALAKAIYDKYHFEDFDKCFRVLDKFLKWTESRDAVMVDVWPSIQSALDELDGMNFRQNQYAEGLVRAIQKRFKETADLDMILLGYSFTPEGRQWYKTLLQTRSTTLLLAPEDVTALMQGALSRFHKLIGADPHVVTATWNDYINSPADPFNRSVTLERNWEMFRARTAKAGRKTYSYMPLALIAQVLMNMPCSESEVERAFSRVRNLLANHRYHMKTDLIEARVILGTNKEAMDGIPPAIWYHAAGRETGDESESQADEDEDLEPDDEPQQRFRPPAPVHAAQGFVAGPAAGFRPAPPPIPAPQGSPAGFRPPPRPIPATQGFAPGFGSPPPPIPASQGFGAGFRPPPPPPPIPATQGFAPGFGSPPLPIPASQGFAPGFGSPPPPIPASQGFGAGFRPPPPPPPIPAPQGSPAGFHQHPAPAASGDSDGSSQWTGASIHGRIRGQIPQGADTRGMHIPMKYLPLLGQQPEGQ
jgi:hypothetical protein